MVKVFISQPMAGRADDEIRAARDAAFARASETLGAPCEAVPSWFESRGAAQMRPLELLGKSLELMAHADVAVFAPGWQNARGCRIEHDCAVAYGVEVVELL